MSLLPNRPDEPLAGVALYDSGNGTKLLAVSAFPPPSATLTTGQVSVGTGATLIHAAALALMSVTISNPGSVTVFLGASASVTISNGHALLAGQSFSTTCYTGDLYGIVASGATTVTYAVEAA